ncbi:hypothetical protein [Thermotoga sp. KOL6]|uniref:hypothetical protein n=1 Tax=Thermotoga sp. KOL6 TaxID=126741 RepID=UPI000C7753A5|nr:hypothetical protein [Thermotoga sp. KOL6]PLV59446.1 hypothetical protein AS005_06820 [Thermotoga sp. KOL6]
MTRNGFLLILLIASLVLTVVDVTIKSERKEIVRLPSFVFDVDTPWESVVEDLKEELNRSILVNEIMKEISDVDYYPEWKSFVFRNEEDFEKAIRIVARETGETPALKSFENDIRYLFVRGMYFILKVK